MKSIIYFTTELKEVLENLNESRQVLSRSPYSFENSMSLNKDFLPSSSPISYICAIEIEAILFLFMMTCYKSSFQEIHIIITVLKIERTRNQLPYCLLQIQKEISFHLLPVGLSWDSFHPPPESVQMDGRTDGWMYADVRTKIFRINRLPSLLTHAAP